jgi:hypothetical protein
MGPVEYVVLSFPGNQFKGEIVPALAELIENGTVRIIDLLFILKDPDGAVTWVELADVADNVPGLEDITGTTMSLLNDEDAHLIAAELDDNSSAALLVWENAWASRFREAVLNANGQLIAHERIPADVVEAAIAYAESEA